MATPTPQDYPDLYDGHDGRPEVTPDQATQKKSYWDSIAVKTLQASPVEVKD